MRPARIVRLPGRRGGALLPVVLALLLLAACGRTAARNAMRVQPARAPATRNVNPRGGYWTRKRMNSARPATPGVAATPTPAADGRSTGAGGTAGGTAASP